MHEPIHCGVQGCSQEATRWIPLRVLTLYLCLDHLCELAYTDDEPDYLGPHEIGVYACSEECDVCNS